MKIYNISDVDKIIEKKINKHIEKFKKIIDHMQVEVFEPDENIVNFNQELRKLRFLLSGSAKITLVHENGKRSIVHFVHEEEFIGELTLIGIEKQHKDVVALSKCICLSISIIEHKEELLRDPDFLLMLSQYIGQKLLKRTWFNMKNKNYELKNVLAGYILMAECNGVYKEKHTETSEFLGVSYRHLLHTFKEFRDEGLITKEKKGYSIDKEKLELLARDIRVIDE